jgi:FKBP-type peptidyl-prolyl cis-trans isomerase
VGGRFDLHLKIAVLKMSVGEKALLTVQPEYGYGAAGLGTSVPPNSVLYFDVIP